jgi:uncharacterized protein (DUF697 family)/GTP-binding protein EngB required for normal cell division
LVEQRSPRLVLVGRRGAGKSSLVNAIFNEPIASIGHTGRGTLEPRWYPYRSERGSLDVLDTRGIGEARTEGESDGRAAAVSMLLDAARTSPPDALLFLVKAKEIESRTDEDVADLNKICRELGQRAGFQLPIIGVLNQCDELSPPTVRLDALDTGARYLQKLEAVRQVEGKLFHRLTPSVVPGTRLVGTLGVVSYAEWDAQGHLIDDLRWRIPELVRVIFDQLPTEAQLELVRLSRVRKLQREVAVRVVQATSAIAAAIAAVPLPVADMAPITSAQVAMLIAIGHIAGRELSVKAATEFLVALGVNVGAGFVFREVTRQLLKWAFPGGGSAVSAAVAYAATLGLGTAAIAYFIDEKSVAEAKEAYKKTRQETENQYRPEAP